MWGVGCGFGAWGLRLRGKGWERLLLTIHAQEKQRGLGLGAQGWGPCVGIAVRVQDLGFRVVDALEQFCTV